MRLSGIILAQSRENDGIQFSDIDSGKELLLIYKGDRWVDWLAVKNNDGRWVTLRKITPEERKKILNTIDIQ